MFMKKYHIRICALCVALLMLAGCGSKTESANLLKQYKMPEISDISSGTAAENSAYRLIWNDEKKSVSIEEKSTGLIWTTLPEQNGEVQYDELGMPIKQHPKLNATLFIKYYDPEDLSTGNALTEINSYTGAVENGTVSCEKIKNGIKVTYYFSSEEFSVPVEYTLSENGLSLSIDPSAVTENTKKIYSISVAPFFCSVANDSDGDYIFIPSGSGAISYPKTVSEGGIPYSKEIYGIDPMVEIWEAPPDEQQIYLPVYGAKSGNKALCAVITEGAQSATIDSTYGSSSYGYTSVYATFNIRGYSFVRTTMFSSKAAKESNLYTDGVINGKCTINYTPLSGENADYSGMASVARKLWLGSDAKSGIDGSDLNLVIYGGIECKKSFLGVPYTSLYAATTLDQAEKIIRELKSETGVSVSVLLKGFGSSGLDTGSIGGDYKIGRGLGSVSDLKKLNSYCKEEGIDSYFNFDMVRKSASGWLSFVNTAKSLNNQTVYQYMYKTALKDRIENSRYSLIARESLVGNIDKLIKKTDNWQLAGVCLDPIGTLAYSDNSDVKYSSKGNMSEDAVSMINSVKESGKKVAVSNANLYAALNADTVFETPSRSSEQDIFSESIPFYQMVFKGYMSISSEAVNHTGNRTRSVLQAVESGTGLTYGLYYNYGSELTDSMYTVFNTGDYENIKQSVIEEVNGLREYYSAVRGATVVKHEILGNGLRRTVFNNGTEVYVNYNDGEISSPVGTVLGHSYLLKTP